MDPAEAQSFLGTGGTNAPPADNFPQIIPPKRPSLAPRTEAALAATTSFADPLKAAFASAEKEYRAQVEQPGVPLDIETGASPWEKFVLSFHREKENQIKYLQNKYGEDNVRLDPNGEMIVRVADTETGKPKDLLVDERTMSAKDLISLAGAVPEIAGGIIALRSGRGLPMLGKARGLLGLQRDVLATAVGGETAGLAKDIAAGISVKGGEDVGKAARERAAMAAGDIALGEVSLGAGRFLKFMESPLAGSRGQVQFDALAAQKYFKDKYGVEVPLSIGESTGSPLVSRTEAFMEKLPGGGTPFKQLKSRQEQAFRQLQSIMMGKTPATDEAVGRATIDALMEKVNPTEAAVETAKGALAKGGTQGLEKVVTELTLPERQLMRSQTGKEVRDAVIAKRDAVKAQSDKLYGVVKAMPGGEGKVFDAQPLQQSFGDILKRLPSPEQITETPTGLVGPDGTPLLRTEKGTEVLKEFVPPNVLARLRAVADLKGAKFSLSDLQQMRREVYDDIAKGEGVPGLGTHYLADIGKAITKAIDEGIEKLPGGGGDYARYQELTKQVQDLVSQKKFSQAMPLQREIEDIKTRNPTRPGYPPTAATGDLKSALKAANEHYKKEVVPFNRIGLTEMFRNPDEAGGLADSEIVSRVFSGGKAVQNFGLMKEVLGEASPEFTKLKRAILDHVLEKSREPGSDLINYSSLANNLSHLRTEYPEIAKDVFGGRLNELFRQGRFVQYAKDSKVSADELKDLMADKSATASRFQELINAEKQRDEMYRNQILRDVATKELPDKALNPIDFVNRFVEKAKPSDVRDVMGLLSSKPALVEDIRAKVVEKLFRNASRSATAGDIGKLLSEDPTRIVTGTSVFKQMEAPFMRDKLKSILGNDVFNDLENYAKLQAGTEIKEQQFAAAGGLAAGMQIANLTRRGPLRYMYEAGKDWMVASLMTRAPLRQWLSSVPASQEPGMVSLILTSPAFLSAVAKDFPGAKGTMLINSIKQSVDKWTKQQQAQEPKPPSILAPAAAPGEQRRREAEQFLGSPMAALQNQLVPAIRTMNGKIVKASPNETTHNDIISKHGLKATDVDQRGFVDAQGKWYDRETAARQTGLPTNNQPGRLHSTDLPRAQE